MLDTDTKRRIDKARDILVGKVPDPKSQVEQITIALIYKFMDDMDKEVEELGGKPTFFKGEFSKYSWSRIFDPRLSGNELVTLYGEAIDKMNLNPNIPQLFRDIFKNAYLPYRNPETLKSFLKIINEFHYSHSEKLGDAYEYLLSVLSSQGDAGQFRTPRHIIDFIVEVVNPQKKDKILDPACGTAGFLISSYKHILKSNTKKTKGDKLTPEDRNKLIGNLTGYDISPDMVRMSLVNMYLHGFSNPKIYEYDTLSSEDRWNEYYDTILANPPFMSPKGGIHPHKRFSIQANRSEVLFVDYIAEHLTPSGKAGIIVPEGIIFQSGNAYKNLRKMLVENYLWAVVSLPAGIFNPYAGVKTSVLLINKQLNKSRDTILFVKIENDGYDLGAQRREIDKNDLPAALVILKEYEAGTLKEKKKGNSNYLIVKKDKISANGDNNLSIDRYKDNEKIFSTKFNSVKLKEICEFEYGKPLKEENRIKGDIPVFGSNGIVGHHNEYIVERPFIVVGRKGSAGAVHYSDNNGYPIDTTFFIKKTKSELINLKYLYYCLLVLDLKKVNTQAGVPGLNRNDAYEEKIPLPPLEIQQEIVSKIESYQKIIDGAKQIVENYKPQIDINPDWEMVELGDICKTEYGFTDTAKDKGNARYIRITDIDENGNLKNDDIKYTNLIKDNSKYLLNNNDLVVARTGATYGKTLLFRENYEAIFASFLIRLNLDNNKILNKYYWFFTQSNSYIEQKQNLVTGGGQPQFNANAIVKIKIPLPDLKEQQQIVDRIEQEQKLIDASKELIKLYEQKIKTEINKVWEK